MFIAAGICVAMWLSLGTVASGTFMSLFMTALLATYLLIPWLQKMITGYVINNYRYGQGKLHSTLTTGRFYRIYLGMLGWALLLFVGILLAFAGVTLVSGLNIMTLAQQTPGTITPDKLPPGVMTPILAAVAVMYLGILLGGVWLKAYVKSRIHNYVFNHTRLDEVMQLNADITTGQLFRLYFINILLMIFTAGLAYPWVRVRTARLMARTTRAQLHGSLDQYVNAQQRGGSAVGEEIGDVFDVGAGLDLAF